MIPRSAFSLHDDVIRYRGEDVARLLLPRTSVIDDFVAALHCAPDVDARALDLDIIDVQQQIGHLRAEVIEALKFVEKWPARAKEILEQILTDAD